MKIYPTILLMLMSVHSFGQDNNANALYVRIGIYEASFGYQRMINENLGLAIEFDYRPKFKDSTYNNIQWASWSSAMEGYRVKPMINYYSSRNTYWSFIPSYRYLEADKLIYDPGKFSGANTSDYEVYSQINHEVGLNVLFNKPFRNHPAFEGYFGGGIQAKFVERHYSIKGSFTYQLPSNEVSHLFYVTPVIYAGIKVKFARF